MTADHPRNLDRDSDAADPAGAPSRAPFRAPSDALTPVSLPSAPPAASPSAALCAGDAASLEALVAAAVAAAVGRGGHAVVARALADGTRDVLQWVRQSDVRQVRQHLGSREDQLAQARHLAPYDLSAGHPRVRLVDAVAETGRRTALGDAATDDREKFEELLALLDTGRYAVLLVALLDRIARNDLDTGRFLDVVRRRRVLILEGSRPYNPANRHDLGQVRQRLVNATGVMEETLERLQVGRRSAASQLRVRNNLPSALVHACPDDPEYRRRLELAGLGAHIVPEALARHQLVTERDGQRLYVLPYPDAEVWQASRAIVAWTVELGSLGEVVARIRRDGQPGWPAGRAGRVPVVRASVWRFNVTVRWARVNKERLRRYLRCVALYGTFRYEARALANGPDAALGEPVVEPAAFQGLATLEEWSIIEGALRRPAVRRRRPCDAAAAYRGARLHALPLVFCAHPFTDRAGVRAHDRRRLDASGQPTFRHPRAPTAPDVCGMRLSARYARDGERWYGSLACVEDRAHRLACTAVLEDVVLQVVRAECDPALLTAGLAALESTEASAAARVAALQRQAEELVAEAALARRDARAAERAGRTREAHDYQTDYRQLAAELAQVEAALADCSAQSAGGAALEEVEFAQVQALARDLPALLDAARAADTLLDAQLRAADAGDLETWEQIAARVGHVRGILEALGVAVAVRPAPAVPAPDLPPDAHAPGDVRVDMEADMGDVEVEVRFPHGPPVVRRAWLRWRASTQAARAYAAARLADGASPAHVAAELTAAWVRIGKPCGPWTAGEVRGAVAYHTMREHVSAPTAALTSVAALAHRVGASPAIVLAAALRGRLGRARVLASAAVDDAPLADPAGVDRAAADPAGNAPSLVTEPVDVRPDAQEAGSAAVHAARLRGIEAGLAAVARDLAPRVLVEAPAWQVENLFRGYARRVVAARRGWALDDTTSLSQLRREYGIGEYDVHRAAVAGGGIARDASGRKWTLRSALVLTDADFLRHALAARPDLAGLDPRYWMPRAEALALLPGVSPTTLQQRAPRCRHQRHGRWLGPVFVHLPPDAVLRFARVALADAVARLAAERGLVLDPGDFHPRRELREWLCARGVGYADQTYVHAVRAGHLLEVRAIPASGQGRPRWHVYVPAAVYTTTRRATVFAWLAGQYPPPAVDASTSAPPAGAPRARAALGRTRAPVGAPATRPPRSGPVGRQAHAG